MSNIEIPICSLLLSGALLLGGCASTVKKSMTNYDLAPAAQGIVKASKEDRNTRVDLSVKHLAPANKIESGASTFVLWAKPSAAEGEPQNVGSLNVDKDDLDGELTTLVPYQQFSLFLTPEPSGNVIRPGGKTVLSTQVGTAE